jgi:hypothetical protein
MNNIIRIRNFGLVCMAAAIIWILAISLEYSFQLQQKSPDNGIMFYLNQILFIIAMLGYLTGIFGLAQTRAGGDGWFAKVAIGLFGLGWSLLILGTLIELFTNSKGFLFPVGGILASLGCLLSGIAIVTAKRWQGWRRWSVLIYALYYWAALFMPLVIANQEPNQITETIWGFAWLLIGFALYSTSRSLEVVPA